MSSTDGFELISRPGERRLLADSEVWCVYEVPADAHVPTPDRCLIFESTKVVRRVRDYPRRWRDLPDPELARVMERQ
ncbi:MAG TPA: hypothetical protein VGJ18_11130 [Gemmatimonadaceae bacterium]|jgi:hypothetical protein